MTLCSSCFRAVGVYQPAPEVSPETDLDLLRSELDAARAEIDRLRRERDALIESCKGIARRIAEAKADQPRSPEGDDR